MFGMRCAVRAPAATVIPTAPYRAARRAWRQRGSGRNAHGGPTGGATPYGEDPTTAGGTGAPLYWGTTTGAPGTTRTWGGATAEGGITPYWGGPTAGG